MKIPLCAVFDKKTALFDQPWVSRHIGEATRQWDIVRKNPENKFGKNPEDFDLYQIGLYDDESGRVENITPHTHLATGI